MSALTLDFVGLGHFWRFRGVVRLARKLLLYLIRLAAVGLDIGSRRFGALTYFACAERVLTSTLLRFVLSLSILYLPVISVKSLYFLRTLPCASKPVDSLWS